MNVAVGPYVVPGELDARRVAAARACPRALVLAFVLVQVGALLGGHRHVPGTAGLTYAEYARRGFAQLVAVLVAGVRWRGRCLPRAVVQVVAAAMLGLALVNPHVLIVRHNVAAERDARLVVGLDVVHLQGLSADAVPEIARLDEPQRSCVPQRVAVEVPLGVADWNLGRERAAQVMEPWATDLTTRTTCRD